MHSLLIVVEQTRRNDDLEARVEALEAVVGKQEATITELSQRCGDDLTSTDGLNVKANHEAALLKRFFAAISNST